jgi:hypothetical protein
MSKANFKILSCPYCGQLYENASNVSLSIMEEDYYSDGYVSSKSYLKIRSIVKCVNTACGKIFDINEAKEVPMMGLDELFDPKWLNVLRLGGYEMQAEDLEEALNSEYCKTVVNEKKVRTFLLWKYNNSIRKVVEAEFSPELNQKALANAEKLIALMDELTIVQDYIFKAELYREYGQFDECINLLLAIKNESGKERIVKEKIFSAAKLMYDRVFCMPFFHIKKEYKCAHCKDEVFLFDLDKIQSDKGFKHYYCETENKIVNAATLELNPHPAYLHMSHEEYLSTINYSDIHIPKEKIVCNSCNSEDVALFNIDVQKCVKCGIGNYIQVKWFNDL